MHYMTANPDAVRTHYRELRRLAHNNARVASSGAVNLRKAAGQMGRLMREIELIERVADKRGISLRQPTQDLAVDFICSSCGGKDIQGEGKCISCRKLAELEG